MFLVVLSRNLLGDTILLSTVLNSTIMCSGGFWKSK